MIKSIDIKKNIREMYCRQFTNDMIPLPIRRFSWMRWTPIIYNFTFSKIDRHISSKKRVKHNELHFFVNSLWLRIIMKSVNQIDNNLTPIKL